MKWLDLCMDIHGGLGSSGKVWKNLPELTRPTRPPHLPDFLNIGTPTTQHGSSADESYVCYGACIKYIRDHASLFESIVTTDHTLDQQLARITKSPKSIVTTQYLQKLLHAMPFALSGHLQQRVHVALPVMYGGHWFEICAPELNIQGVK